MSRAIARSLRALALIVGGSALLAGCERPPIDSVQHGYRGTAMVQVYNPRTVDSQAALNTAPVATPQAPADGPKASQVYQNVQLLGDLSVGQFNRHMAAITSWIAPEEGCGYCHNLANFAEDTKYQKVVSRKMLQMTQNLNANWKTHVAETGVTCYTCHRGKNIPDNVWFEQPVTPRAGLLGNDAGQNHPAPASAMASLPYDPFTPFIAKEPEEIRVITQTALPTGNRQSTKQTEWTYGLMMHMSTSLGVNCTYCHNSRSFGSWETSSPQRSTAWYGIRMVRDSNVSYMDPLTATFPAHRKGPLGDVAKVNCTTCHQGAYKPLYGAQMAKDYPELQSVKATLAAPSGAPASAPADAPTSAAPATATMLFAVNSAELPSDASSQLLGLVGALKADPAAKVVLSGFHSATGDLSANQELAKKRAFAVRDALQAAGVEPTRVELEKPASAEANLAGEDAQARRVEVSLR